MGKSTMLSIMVMASVAASAAEVKVDFARATGPVKPVNAVGQPPIIGLERHDMFHYLKEAGIPYSRLHDTYGEYGSNVFVDVPNIFRDFDADADDPANYDFAFTDLLLKQLIANGVEPFYRLGVTIENYPHVKTYRIAPPKNPVKWARICEHIVRHYTQGWANGFNFKIIHWEIWNEPDINPDPKLSMMWQGTFAEYCRLYEVTAKYLKERHPNIKVGGFASCGFGVCVMPEAQRNSPYGKRKQYWLRCNREFLAYVRDHKCPLDFFSYHSYDTIDEVRREIDEAERTLAEFGFAGTETWLNEWLPQPNHDKLGTAQQAAEIAGMMLMMQNSPLSAACLYDARCGIRNYSPLFNPFTFKPHKAYHAFTAFNELRKRGTAVAVTVRDAVGLQAAAAKGADDAVVMVANPTAKAVPLALDLGGRAVASCRVTDGARTEAQTDLPKELPPYSICVVVAK